MTTAFDIIERKIKEDMVAGQRHVARRDLGRLAGGYAASGSLTARDLLALEDLVAGRSDTPKEARRLWRESVEYGRGQPVKLDAPWKKQDSAVGFGWDDPVHVGKPPAEERPVIDDRNIEAADIPAPAQDWQPADMIRYLEVMFEPDERVGLCINAFQKADGKWAPKGAGVWDKTRAELVAALQVNLHDIGAVIGDVETECGAYVRINPLDGDGAKDANITAFRHSLIECEPSLKACGEEYENIVSSPILLTEFLGKQLAIIRELRLPCSCIVHSGGKSIHALVKVDAADAADYRRRVDRLYDVCEKSGLKVDRSCGNPSRLSRLPGVERKGSPQYMIDGRCGSASFEEWQEFVEDVHDQLPDPESLASIWDNLPPLAPEIISGVLRQGHKLLLAGPSKAAKSFGLIELCICIAEGKPWMGWECQQGPVLYVNLELDRPSCLHRFKGVYEAMGCLTANVGNIEIWNLRGSAVPLDKLAPKLIRRAQKRNYIAVVIDPIYKILTGDENSAEEMANFCNQFDRIATTLGAATIYAHHHSKGSQGGKRAIDRSSGSGVFGRDPDACLDLIELDISKDRRVTLADRMFQETLEGLATGLGLDLSGIPMEARQPADAFMMAFQTSYPKFGDEARYCRLESDKRVKAMSGWRIEASLREFATPEHRRIWFQYPIHVPDHHGLLLDAKAAGEDPPWEASRKAKDDIKRANAESAKAEMDAAIDAAGGSCRATIQAVSDELGVTKETVRNRIKKMKHWKVENNTIFARSVKGEKR